MQWLGRWTGLRGRATLGKLFTHTCDTAQVSVGQRVVMPGGLEGNCRSGVALAMRHRLQ